MSDVRLLVNDRRYGGWKRVQVSRSVESIAGSFSLGVTDRWSDQDEPWAIAEEDACRVEIDGQIVIDGHVDRRSIAMDAGQRSVTVSGRDRAAVLVDCSAFLGRYTFRRVNILDLVREIAAPFGITVTLQAGLTLPPAPAKLVINPGDSAFQAIERAAQVAGVMVVSDGAGGIVLTRSGTTRAAPLVLGQNILAGAVDYDTTGRYHRYVVVAQTPGADTAAGDATRIRAEAIDEEVRRTDRVLMVRPDAGIPTELARRRGDWEARIRAARADTVRITVRGWQQPDGTLWPINALVNVQASALGVSGDLLITQADHSLSESGEVTDLRLVRPDAFTPEPTARVKRGTKTRSGGGAWKEFSEAWVKFTGGDL